MAEFSQNRTLDGVGVLRLIDEHPVKTRQADAIEHGAVQEVVEVQLRRLVRRLQQAAGEEDAASHVAAIDLKVVMVGDVEPDLLAVLDDAAHTGLTCEADQFVGESAVGLDVSISQVVGDDPAQFIHVDGFCAGRAHDRAEAQAVKRAGVDTALRQLRGDGLVEGQENAAAGDALQGLDDGGGLAASCDGLDDGVASAGLDEVEDGLLVRGPSAGGDGGSNCVH